MKNDRHLLLLLVLLWLGGSRAFAETIAAGPLQRADALQVGFEHPFSANRPQSLWFWLNGHISRKGITADIEAMSKNHIRGALMYAVGHEKQAGPVRFMSDEWLDLFLHAVREADRCGTEIGIHNGAGWSASGGPWIDAEHGMQILTTSRTYAEGRGEKQVLVLPKPWSNLGYYRDVAVIAYPSGPTMSDVKAVVTSSSEIDGTLLLDGRPDTQITLPGVKSGQRFIQLEFPAPITAEGLLLSYFGSTPGSGGEVQVSDDGKKFRTVSRFDYYFFLNFKFGQHQLSFAPTTGKVFRLKFDKADGETYRIGEVELVLTPTVKGFMAKAGYYTPVGGTGGAYAWGASRADGPNIPSGQVVDLTKLMDAEGGLKWTVPPGKWTVLRVGQTASGMEAQVPPSGISALECDKLSKQAVKIHYDSYVGHLAKLCGPLAGKSFTYATVDSFEVGPQNWTAGLAKEFRKRRGYDLIPFLPLLLTGRVEDSVEVSERFLEDYRRTLQELMLENYYGYLKELCNRDHLKFWSENYHSMFCDTLDIGGRIDVAQGEFWSNLQKDLTVWQWCAKHASSCSQVYGLPLVPAEAFTSHLDGWTESPKTLKAKGDLMYASGFNQFAFHRYAHQPWLDREPGMTMGPNGIHMDRTNTWWDESSAWIAYLERCQSLLQQGSVMGQIVILTPEFVPSQMSIVDALNQWAKRELPRGTSYLFCSQNGLLKNARIEKGQIRFPLGEGYRLVVLPDTKISSPELLAKIRNMLKAGITVYAPQRPDRALGLRDRAKRDLEIQELVSDIWGEVDGKAVTSRKVGKGLLVQGVSLAEATRLAGIQPDFDFANADGTPVSPYKVAGNVQQVNAIHRRVGEREIYFVANHTQQDQRLVCRFGVAGMTPERWDPLTGRMEQLTAWREVSGATELPLDFGPAESAFIVFRPGSGADSIVSLKHADNELFPAWPNHDVAANATNAGCDWRLATDASGVPRLKTEAAGVFTATTARGKTWQVDAPVLPAPIAISGPWQVDFQSGRGAPATAQFPTLISWSDHDDQGIRYFSGYATYRNKFTVPPGLFRSNRRLILSLGDVEVIAVVKVNGKDCGTLWHAPYEVDVTDALQANTNELEIRVVNLWPNRIIGDLRSPGEKPFTFCQTQLFSAKDALLPSGLLGPVEVRVRSDLPVGILSR